MCRHECENGNEEEVELFRERGKMKIEKKKRFRKRKRGRGKKEEKEGERVRAGMSQNRSGLRGPFPLSMRGIDHRSHLWYFINLSVCCFFSLLLLSLLLHKIKSIWLSHALDSPWAISVYLVDISGSTFASHPKSQSNLINGVPGEGRPG